MNNRTRFGLLGIFLFAGLPTAFSANSLDVEFSGELISTTCQIATESVNQKITIDNLGWQSINENKTSAVTPFSIGINKCTDTDLQKSIKLTWKSNQLTAVGENYFLTTQGDSGALLGLIDQNGHPVIWNKPMTLGTVSMVDSTQKFDFGVYVRKPSTGEIKVGDFAGTVTFTVEYE